MSLDELIEFESKMILYGVYSAMARKIRILQENTDVQGCQE